MTPARPVDPSGTFVSAGAGYRFRLVCEPAAGAVRGTVVFVHAFAEEMNKSRRMVARTARALAADGWRVVQRDLCGCGDSSGDFGEATWPAWIDDVADELTRAADDGPAWLWCERAGTLLAAPALATRPGVDLLLWQPVTSGSQHLQQFLRLHAGARIVGSAKAEAGESPLQRLRSGVAVEVAGYDLNPALAMGLERAAFDLPAGFTGRVIWLEVSPDESPELALPSQRVIEALRSRGIAVEAQALRGPPFWQTQEIEECEALLETTRAALAAEATPSAKRPPGKTFDLERAVAP